VGSPWAVDGLDPPSAHAHQPSRHYFCWAWALGGFNGRSIILRLSYAYIYRHRGQNEVERATYCIGRLSKFSEVILSFKKYPCLSRAESR